MSSALLPALVVFLVAAALSVLFIRTQRTKRHLQEGGIAALAGMKWRDCANLFIQALKARGYALPVGAIGATDSGSDFELVNNGARTLVSYKHGTAYQLDEDNVRDFANALQVNGIGHGILATLGLTSSEATAIAKKYNIEVMDGTQVWAAIQPQLNESTLQRLRGEAAVKSRRETGIGIGASGLLGALVFFMNQGGDSLPSSSIASAPATAPSEDKPDASRAHLDAAEKARSDELQAAAKRMAEVAAMTDEQRATRRVEAAKEISTLGQVRTAAWSANSTLVLGLSTSDGKDERLVAEVCRLLLKREELRYTRVQLEPPHNSDLRVRWTQCQ